MTLIIIITIIIIVPIITIKTILVQIIILYGGKTTTILVRIHNLIKKEKIDRGY
jgi:hypothetical protein